MPERNLIFKDDNCNVRKNSKDRLTDLFCTNADVSDKRTPVVIGKFRKPKQCYCVMKPTQKLG